MTNNMIIELKLTLDYNPDTGEVSIVSQKQQKAKKSSKSTSTKVETELSKAMNLPEAVLFLDSGKYYLNDAAFQLMGLDPEDLEEEIRFDIKYKKKDGVAFPILGMPKHFGTVSGNKLTKSKSVACRGNAELTLREYGTTFKLVPLEDNNNLYELVDINKKEEDIKEHVKIPTFSSDESDNIIDVDPFDFEL